jgi:hypothetical protein
MEVFLKNSDGMHGFDDRDCGQSGAWWLYGNCVECNKEQEDVG